MKVSELIQLLSQCHPDSPVELNIPCYMLDAKPDTDLHMQYVVQPSVAVLWSGDSTCSGLANCFSISIPDEEIAYEA